MKLGIDIGGTTLKAGVVDEKTLEVQENKSWPTGPDTDCETLVRLVSDAIEYFASRYSFSSVGIGSPGPLGLEEGIIYETANFPKVKNCRLPKLLQVLFPNLQFKMDNDANCATYGLFRQMNRTREEMDLPSADHFCAITLGTGVGGGLILHRKIFHGPNENAFEVGHITLTHPDLLAMIPEPLVCGCGKTYCFETYASATAVKKHYKNITGKEEEAGEIARLAEEGDADAKKVYEIAGFAIGLFAAQLYYLLGLLDLHVTGGMAAADEFMTDAMWDAFSKAMPPHETDMMQVWFTDGDPVAGIIGVALL